MTRKGLSAISGVLAALYFMALGAQHLHGLERSQREEAFKPPPVSYPERAAPAQHDKMPALTELERAVTLGLERYSNIHRGKGQYSMISTELFERAREIVRKYLGVGGDHQIIFGSVREIDILKDSLKDKASYKVLHSDRETGLRFGVAALAVKKESLPDTPPVVGGGEVDDVGDTTVAWSEPPDKFEAGTPNITGVIMLAKALELIQRSGDRDIFRKELSRARAGEVQTDPFPGLSGSRLLSAIRQTLVGKDILVPSEEGEVAYINLDNGASTPTFSPIMKDAFASLRVTDEEARRTISDAKSVCASYFNAPAAEYECILTLNTTESINIAGEISSTIAEGPAGAVVIGTDLEHNSNELPWRKNELIHLPVDWEGYVDLAALERQLREYNQSKSHGNKRIVVVTVSGASNVLGTFNDIGAIARLAHRYGAYLHVDAAQLAAHRDVDMASTGIDMLSCSGHKMYAPFGTGCLIVRKDLLTKFGRDELIRIRESGERNLMGIAALKRSMEILKRIGLDNLEKEERELTARVMRGLSGLNGRYGGDMITIFGIQNPDGLQNKGPVVTFCVDGIPHNIVAARLAEIRGIGVREGCFCAHRLIKFLLSAQDRDVSSLMREGKAPGLVRVSIGIENTSEDVDEFIRTLAKVIDDPDSKSFIPGASDCRYCAGKPTVSHEISKKIEAFVTDIVSRVYGG